MRTDRASRLIRAPLARVYAAFVDPAALVRWLPPEGMTGEMLDFDAGPGGSYRMALTYQDEAHAPGKTSDDGDVVEVRYLALVPNVKIIQSAEFEAEDPAFAGTMVMSWTFEAAGDATRVAIACDNVPAGIRKQDHVAGLKSSLANLACFVEANG
ncbi:SRPBCC family protein [Sphingomonas sp. M1-B02]|uniref:SRPBCC family protein n=1 Tax=Sphingomonas sp. M1-B02 TaxID=3114300 RepID=UPI002240882C|nr:SRPBCC family protein [Sphingomonas sp. S6-11]UZK64935.1 SRPBCC family protein [Sphingomonas sp. S6-11]